MYNIHNEERDQYEKKCGGMNVVVQFILYKTNEEIREKVSMDEVVKRENCVNFYVNGIHISTQCSSLLGLSYMRCR